MSRAPSASFVSLGAVLGGATKLGGPASTTGPGGAASGAFEGAVSGAFLVGYGVLRFVAEYFREPDDFLGLRALNWSQGQWLSLPMILAGLAIFVWASRRNERPA